jgi:hypothetical protein
MHTLTIFDVVKSAQSGSAGNYQWGLETIKMVGTHMLGFHLTGKSNQNPMPVVGNPRNEEGDTEPMMRLKVMAATAQSPNYKRVKSLCNSIRFQCDRPFDSFGRH